VLFRSSALVASPFASGRYSDARIVDPVLEQVVADAAARAAEEGRAEGFTQGYAEGTARAAAESALELAATRERHEAEHRERMDRVTSAIAALDAAVHDLEARTAPAAAELERLALVFAVDNATTLIGHELALSASPALDAVRRALALAPVDTDLLVRLHPADAAAAAEGVRAAAPGRTVEIVADPAVEPGGCVLDAGACHVDAQLGPALERVRAALA
jgi:flagellar assembly protein FliH